MEDKFEDSKGQSEAINQIMTNKAMTKRKRAGMTTKATQNTQKSWVNSGAPRKDW
jgi:hypothetical protein